MLLYAAASLRTEKYTRWKERGRRERVRKKRERESVRRKMGGKERDMETGV